MRMISSGLPSRCRSFIPVLSAMLISGLAFAQEAKTLGQGGGMDPAVEQEIEYAQMLQNLGMPDYAQMVIERIKAPEAKVWIERLKIQSLLSMGQFDAVRGVIGKRPDADSQETWALKLALADALYAFGRYAEAQGVYVSFFKKYSEGPTPAIKNFYIESAYKYAQMLLLMNNPEAAIESYRYLLKVQDLDKGIKRQALAEMAELLIKRAEELPADKRAPIFTEVLKISEELAWVPDVWFGKAVVFMAHVRMLQDDIEGAEKIVDRYRGTFKTLDDSLKEESDKTGEDFMKLSPMAQCRFMLGEMLFQRAQKLIEEGEEANKTQIVDLLAGKKVKDKRVGGAYQHFLNVFINYPTTQWAGDSGKRADQIEDILINKFGAKITKKITPEQMETVKRIQFQEARNLYNLQQFPQAADAYLRALSLYPEGEMGVSALGDLIRCYIEMKDELLTDVAVSYLAERFSGQPNQMTAAGDDVLRIADRFGEMKLLDKRDAAYGLFFQHYAAHPRMSPMLFKVGQEKFDAGDFDGALTNFQQIVTGYANSPLALMAMDKIASCYHHKEDVAQEIKALEAYIEQLSKKDRPGHAVINARYRVASAYRSMGEKYVPSAFNRYTEIIKLVSQKDNPYQNSPEEAKANEEMLEAAMYFQAVCYSQLKDKDEAKMRQYKEAALKSLEALIQRFPKSRYAPSALSQIGTLYTVFEKPKEAEDALNRLMREYPESVEAQNAKFVLAMNLLNLGRRKQAVEVFKEMFSGSGQYKPTQILTAGNELVKAKEYEIAIEAFDRVMAMAKDERPLIEPVLIGKGRSYTALKQYAEACKALEDLLARYPNSGNTVEAAFTLSSAYSEQALADPDSDKRFDLFNLAVKAITKARAYDKTPGGQARSEVEVGRIQARKAAAEKKYNGPADRLRKYQDDAIVAYQVLIMLSDPGVAEVRPFIEDAMYECLPLLLETQRYSEVLEDADRFIELFPRSRYLSEMRGWRTEARTKLVAQGQASLGMTPGGTNAPAGQAAPGADTNAPAKADDAAPAVPAP